MNNRNDEINRFRSEVSGAIANKHIRQNSST